MRRFVEKAALRVCRRLDITALYQSEVGIKCTNQLVKSEAFDLLASGERFTVEVDRLHLWIDGLKDPYTLLGTPIGESPHFGLVKTLHAGESPWRTDYVKRMIRGTLDLRVPYPVDEAFIRSAQEGYRRILGPVESGTYQPIKVARVGGRFYIADGKHRAALCALLGITPVCVDVSVLIYDSFFCWMFRRMASCGSGFDKHIKHFELAQKRS